MPNPINDKLRKAALAQPSAGSTSLPKSSPINDKLRKAALAQPATSPTEKGDTSDIGRRLENFGVGVARTTLVGPAQLAIDAAEAAPSSSEIGGRSALSVGRMGEFAPQRLGKPDESPLAPEFRKELARMAGVAEQRAEEDPWMVYSGDIAGAFAPTSLFGKVKKGAEALSTAKKTLPLWKKIGKKSTEMGAAGAGFGAAQPISAEAPEIAAEQRMANIKGGATVGGFLGVAAPLGAKAGKTVWDIMTTWNLPQSVLRTVGDKVGDTAGSKLKGVAEGIDKELFNNSLRKLANEVESNLDKLNKIRVSEGKDPFTADQALSNIDQWVNEIGRINKEYGTKVGISSDTLAKAPYLTQVLRKYGVNTNSDVASIISGGENAEAYAKILNAKRKTPNKYIDLTADTALANSTTKVATPTVPLGSTATPQEIEEQAVNRIIAQNKAEGDAFKAKYGELEKRVGSRLKFSEPEFASEFETLVGDIEANPSRFIGLVERFPSTMKRRLKVNPETGEIGTDFGNVSYNELKQWGDEVQAAVDASKGSDALAIELRNWLKGTGGRGGLTNKLIDVKGSADDLAMKRDLDAQYKQFQDKARLDIVGEDSNPIAKRRNSFIARIRGITDTKDFNYKGILNNLLRDKETLEQSVKEFPELADDAEEYLYNRLVESTKGQGLNQKVLDNFRAANANILKSPSLSNLNSRLDNLQTELTEKTAIAEADLKRNAVLDILRDPRKVDNLFSDQQRTADVLKYAQETGTIQDVQRMFRDSILRRSVTAPEGEAARLSSATLLDAISNTNSTERKVFDAVFSAEQKKPILDAIKLLQKEASAVKIQAAADAGLKEMTAMQELAAIIFGVLTPAQATRLGFISRIFGSQNIQDAAKLVATDPEVAKKLLQLSKDPSRNNLTGFFSMVEDVKAGAMYPAITGYAQDEEDINNLLNPSSTAPSYGSSSGGTPSGKVTEGQVPSEPAPVLSPQTQLKTLEDHLRVVDQAADATGLPKELGYAILLQESSGGQDAAMNSGNFVGPMQMGAPAFQEALKDPIMKKMGFTTADRANPVANIYAGVVYAKQQARALMGKLGRKPKDYEVYIAYADGMGGFMDFHRAREQGDNRKGLTGNLAPRPVSYKEYEKLYKDKIIKRRREAANYV